MYGWIAHHPVRGLKRGCRIILRNPGDILLHQRYKDLCFLGLSKATLPNYWIRKWTFARRPQNGKPLHLHLRCGTKYLPGFLNIDANPMQKIDCGWMCAVGCPL